MQTPQPRPPVTQGLLNVCTGTLAGSVPMLNTDCLPPSQPPQESRLDAESLPKYGCLPAPKIPPVIRGATGLASICGTGAATVTERTSPGDGLVAHLGLFSPKVSGLLAKACGGLLSQTCLCRSNASFSQGKFGSTLECAFPVFPPTPLILFPKPPILGPAKKRPGAWDGKAAGTGDSAGLRSQEHCDL